MLHTNDLNIQALNKVESILDLCLVAHAGYEDTDVDRDQCSHRTRRQWTAYTASSVS